MTDKVLLTVLTAVIDWRLPASLMGTAALMKCASMAIEREQKGEPWTPMGVCHDYARGVGRTQWNVWRTMSYALKLSRGPDAPGEAIEQIVERGRQDGCIEIGETA